MRAITNYTSIGKYQLRSKTLNILVMTILLSQEDTFFISVEDSTDIETQEEIY